MKSNRVGFSPAQISAMAEESAVRCAEREREAAAVREAELERQARECAERQQRLEDAELHARKAWLRARIAAYPLDVDYALSKAEDAGFRDVAAEARQVRERVREEQRKAARQRAEDALREAYILGKLTTEALIRHAESAGLAALADEFRAKGQQAA